jgi:integrase
MASGRAKTQKTKYPGVYKRETSHGRVYDIAYRVPGEKNPKWIRGQFRDLAAANKHRLDLLHEIAHGSLPSGAPKSLAAFVADDWLPRQHSRVAEGQLRSSTYAQYARDARNHLIPALGTTRLDRVDVSGVEKLKDDLLSSGLSPDTARRVENTLGYVLKYARKRRIINYNPVEDADKPSPRRREPTLPTLGQIYAVADAARTEADGRMILFAAFTGLRMSELLGLRWDNTDLTAGEERIRVVEQFYKGEHVASSKTRAGNREIVLGSEAADVLREHAVAQQVDAHPNHHNLVFPSPKGEHWRDSNFNRRVWQPARKEAGLAELMFHTLRYFWISTVSAQELPPALTQQLVGHSDERTHQGYTRPIPGTESLIRDAQSGVFARPLVDDRYPDVTPEADDAAA